MNLREYLIKKIASEESTVDSILEIDNTIELTNLTKEDIIFAIKQTYDNNLNGFDGEEFDAICDGELNSFFYIILNYGEKIKATTWSKNAIRCYAYRDFKVYDEQGNVIILASSKWVLVDTIKGKIVRIDDELLKKYQPELDMFAFDSQNEDFHKMCSK